MRRLSLYLFVIIIITSCVSLQKPSKTIDQVKANLICIEYKEGMAWKKISNMFGEPDIAPLPEPGKDLSVNTRGYKGIIIIFHTKREKYMEEGKLRFKEVVDKVEICKRN